MTVSMYKCVSPESSFIAEVSLLSAHLTLVLPAVVSSAQLTQRCRVTSLVCSRNTACTEEICHT